MTSLKACFKGTSISLCGKDKIFVKAKFKCCYYQEKDFEFFMLGFMCAAFYLLRCVCASQFLWP